MQKAWLHFDAFHNEYNITCENAASNLFGTFWHSILVWLQLSSADVYYSDHGIYIYEGFDSHEYCGFCGCSILSTEFFPQFIQFCIVSIA